MWARSCELVLAAWLAASPVFLGHGGTVLMVNDLVCAFLITGFAALSFVHRLRYLHLASLAVALWLMVLGYLNAQVGPGAASQNHLVLGLLLLMFPLVPTDATKPPPGWRTRWAQSDPEEG